MDYKQCLMQEQFRRMVDRNTIRKFLKRFAANHDRDAAAQRTVIFFPGGMGSELARANRKFDPALPSGSYSYDTVWYDVLGVLFNRRVLELDMAGDLDRDGRIVVADGAIENCLFGAYDDFETWCEDKNLDLLVVGWDFRRSGDWAVEFFFDYLLPGVRAEAAKEHLPDPFEKTAIVGHSFGGMLVKWILNRHADPFCQNLQLAVTVAAPFYGSAGQAHRYFDGEPLAGLTTAASQIAKVIATMKGGYSLLFLDESTYDTYRPELSADPEFPLLSYPSIDHDTGSRVDPYNPLPGGGGEIRYPDHWAWFSDYLDEGLKAYRQVAVPLDASVAHKLHCIRGVQWRDNAAKRGTAVSQRWHWFDRTEGKSAVWEKDPEDFGAGDGVIPAWSARLATQPPENIHTIKGRLHHTFIMDDTDVRSKLLTLLRGLPAPPEQQIAPGEKRIDPAPRDDFYAMRDGLEGIVGSKPEATAKVQVGLRIAKLSVTDRQAFMKRWYMELLRGPLMPLKDR